LLDMFLFTLGGFLWLRLLSYVICWIICYKIVYILCTNFKGEVELGICTI